MDFPTVVLRFNYPMNGTALAFFSQIRAEIAGLYLRDFELELVGATSRGARTLATADSTFDEVKIRVLLQKSICNRTLIGLYFTDFFK